MSILEYCNRTAQSLVTTEEESGSDINLLIIATFGETIEAMTPSLRIVITSSRRIVGDDVIAPRNRLDHPLRSCYLLLEIKYSFVISVPMA
jgi:hypothetical protein